MRSRISFPSSKSCPGPASVGEGTLRDGGGCVPILDPFAQQSQAWTSSSKPILGAPAALPSSLAPSAQEQPWVLVHACYSEAGGMSRHGIDAGSLVSPQLEHSTRRLLFAHVLCPCASFSVHPDTTPSTSSCQDPSNFSSQWGKGGERAL